MSSLLRLRNTAHIALCADAAMLVRGRNTSAMVSNNTAGRDSRHISLDVLARVANADRVEVRILEQRKLRVVSSVQRERT